MARRLSGKVAIVTGAAPVAEGVGNGKATAILFAREAASVLLVNRRRPQAEQLQREIEAEGGRCAVFAGDVTDAATCERMVRTAVAHFGRLDILVNNVGSGGPGTALSVTDDMWEHCLKQNLRSTLLCCRYAIPAMIESGGGSIVNVSSVAAAQGFRRGDVGFVAYSTAKAGVVGLTRAVAADHAAQGIRANCLLVGMVNTPQMAKFGEAHRERRRLAVPLKTEGSAWDVGWAAVYLASDEARWVTGVALPVDGGQMSLREWPE